MVQGLGSPAISESVAGRYTAALLRIVIGAMITASTIGCMSLPRATCSDEAFAQYIHAQGEKLPIPGIYELRTTAAGGHVTIGGRVDSPETLRQLVRAVANTPGLTQLSFFGVEFEPADVPDDVIVSSARAAAASVIGEDIVSKLGFYCEDHRLFVYGTLPSLPMREKLEETIRQVPGVGLYHVSCEIVLMNPPSDAQVVAAVRRKFRKPLEMPNLTFRASQVQVASVNNVVYLSGKASTLAGKLSAAAQAAQIEGVRYVVNRIDVPGVRITDRPQPLVQPDGSIPEDSTLNPEGVNAYYEFDPELGEFAAESQEHLDGLKLISVSEM
jgi:osmotically-inducible protein OsmY